MTADMRNEILQSAARAAERVVCGCGGLAPCPHDSQRRWSAMSIRALKSREVPAESAPAATPQPPPQGDGTPILPLVIADLQARAEMGKRKYGTELRADNGRDALMDAYQETLDLAMYLRQKLEEVGAQRPDWRDKRIEELRRDLRDARAEIGESALALDEFAPHHTGKSLHESIRDVMAMLRGALARERVAGPARSRNEPERPGTEPLRCPTCTGPMENRPRAGHPVWFVCRGCDQVEAGG